MKGMAVLTSVYQRCKQRLRKNDFGVKLWAYLCVGLFVLALTISMLGCAGAQLTPRLTRGGDNLGSESLPTPSTLGANPIATLTLHFD